MSEKELLAYLVAHNLIRCAMAEAVARHEVDLERLSLKGSAAIDRARNKKCAASYGTNSCMTWPATWCANDPAAPNHARSNAVPNLFPC